MTISNDILKIFSEQLNLEVPSADVDLIGEGVLDSLMFVEFLLHLERRFGIKVSLEDLEMENFRSVNAIAKFVQRSLDTRVPMEDNGMAEGFHTGRLKESNKNYDGSQR